MKKMEKGRGKERESEMERLAAGQQGSRKNKAMLNEREADTEKQQQQHQQQQPPDNSGIKI